VTDNIAVEQGHRGRHYDCASHIYMLLMNTNTYSTEAE